MTDTKIVRRKNITTFHKICQHETKPMTTRQTTEMLTMQIQLHITKLRIPRKV